MKRYDRIYINGRFVTPHGTATLDLVNPSTEEMASVVTLGDEEDTRAAIAAARAAFPAWSQTTVAERAQYLERLYEAVKARAAELTAVMIEEYGGTMAFCQATTQRSMDYFLQARDIMLGFDFERTVGQATVVLEPLGVVGIITPWNASNGFICSKLAMALASGSTAVIKPSELSAGQTQILMECLHEANLPPGVYNVVNGLGDVVGGEMTRHPDIAKMTFTGSTAVGKAIARGAVDTMKRVTLELGGKSPNVLLDDADFDAAIPTAVRAAFMNSGQACLAATRLLVPESRLEEVKRRLEEAISRVRVGDPHVANMEIGPMVSAKQYERVQSYIRLGSEEGAELIVGGEGRPAGLDRGYFVKPTAFVATNDMRIAREEVFGPVLCVLTYRDEAEAIRIANDTVYGLHGYVSSGDRERATRVAAQIVAGRVFINGLYDEPLAPFGGFKQSGIGREFGTFGFEEYLEPKAIMGHV